MPFYGNAETERSAISEYYNSEGALWLFVSPLGSAVTKTIDHILNGLPRCGRNASARWTIGPSEKRVELPYLHGDDSFWNEVQNPNAALETQEYRDGYGKKGTYSKKDWLHNDGGHRNL